MPRRRQPLHESFMSPQNHISVGDGSLYGELTVGDSYRQLPPESNSSAKSYGNMHRQPTTNHHRKNEEISYVGWYKTSFGIDRQLYIVLGFAALSTFSIAYCSIQMRITPEPSFSNSIRGLDERVQIHREMLSHRPRTVEWNMSHSHFLPQPDVLLHLPQDFIINSTNDTGRILDLSISIPEFDFDQYSLDLDIPPGFDTSRCLPIAEWTKANFPNCNSFHEIDMKHSVSTVITHKDNNDEGYLQFLGEGFFRSVWKYQYDYAKENPSSTKTVVLKTFRPENIFFPVYWDLHRREAVAMDRLTASPYVVDIHGYCGLSAINEFAEGDLRDHIKHMRGREEDPQTLFEKLELATQIGMGLIHVHHAPVAFNNSGSYASVQDLLREHSNSSHSTTTLEESIRTMSHYDIKTPNIIITAEGSAKLNDFNVAKFLTYDPETMNSCGFWSELHDPWFRRAPEEMNTTHEVFVDEKVDIYSFGSVLYEILTTRIPYEGINNKDNLKELQDMLRQGIRPTMLEPFASVGENGYLKENRIVQAFFKAMDMCSEYNPSNRGTAIQVTNVLLKALAEEQENRRKEKESQQRDTEHMTTKEKAEENGEEKKR